MSIEPIQLNHLDKYMYDCGIIPDNEFKKMFPRRENYKVNKGIKLRKDGNFIMYACETEKFYYVICFATSWYKVTLGVKENVRNV